MLPHSNPEGIREIDRLHYPKSTETRAGERENHLELEDVERAARASDMGGFGDIIVRSGGVAFCLAEGSIRDEELGGLAPVGEEGRGGATGLASKFLSLLRVQTRLSP